jgi:hypothetical protein
MANVWYAIVGFGPCLYSRSTFKNKDEAQATLDKLGQKDPSGWTRANSRVYGYRTRKQARSADISDHLRGDSGRVAC